MSALRRLGCRLRGGHDVAVVVVVAELGASVLTCDRCGRRLLVPYRGAMPPTLAERAAAVDVVTVDRDALELLMLTAAVDASSAGMLDGSVPS